MYTQSYEQVVMADQPVGYWRPTGTADVDVPSMVSTATAFTPTASNDFTFAAGLSSSTGTPAFRSSGTTAKRYVASIPSLNVVPITLEVWMRYDTTLTTNTFAGMFGRYDSTLSEGFFYRPGVQDMRAVWHNPGVIVADTIIPRQSNWLHCVLVLTPSDGQWYLNDRLLSRLAFISNSAMTDIFIADNPRSAARYPTIFAEPAVYNYALTPEQVTRHYRAGLARLAPARRLAYYPLAAPPPPPPPPGGLTPITTALSNRRLAVVSDRPR
jgi:hypothetical protein